MMSYFPYTPFWIVFPVHVGEEDGPRLGYDCGWPARIGGWGGLACLPGGRCVMAAAL